MRFTKKEKPYQETRWVGTKKGFKFTYTPYYGNQFYVTVLHKTKDIRYNSLWDNITFPSREEVENWCDTFEPGGVNCIGVDVTK